MWWHMWPDQLACSACQSWIVNSSAILSEMSEILALDKRKMHGLLLKLTDVSLLTNITVCSMCICHFLHVGQRTLSSIFMWSARTTAMFLGLMSLQPCRTLWITLLTSLCWAVIQVWITANKNTKNYPLNFLWSLNVKLQWNLFQWNLSQWELL